jgi:antitoxin VapB
MERHPNDEATDTREPVDREGGQQTASLAERLLSIGKDCAAHLPEPSKSKDHAELLYDDKGLPADN